MRIGAAFSFTLCFTLGLCAQTRVPSSVVHPAGGVGTPGVSRSLGSVVNPANGGTRIPGGRAGYNRGGYISGYPVFIGGYYGAPYISSYDDPSQYAAPPPQQNVTVVTPPPQPVTPVVINYNYYGAPPPGQDTAASQGQAPEDTSAAEPSHYLIAFKDHTIYAATAYWVDGDTLHYFTDGNVHNQASLSLVDRDLTQRLNKEAGVDVSIPAPAK